MDVKQQRPPVQFARPEPGPAASPAGEPWYSPPPKSLMSAGKVMLVVLLSLATLVVGAWAAVSTFAGPAYGYPIDNAGAWQQTSDRMILHLVPGAAAALCGFLLLLLTAALRKGRGRFIGTLSALIVIAAGAWLVVGPTALAAYMGSSPAESVSGSQRHVLLLRMLHEWGPGLLLVAFGAWSLGLQAVGRRPQQTA